MWIERLERNMQVACSLRRDCSTNYYTTLKEKRKEKKRKKKEKRKKRKGKEQIPTQRKFCY